MNTTVDEFSRWEYQNIALAAVTQCASLVSKLAWQGEAPQSDILACVNPLLVLNPESSRDIYPNVGFLNLGLRTLQDVLSNNKLRENAELIRYTLGMLLLRNKLNSNQSMQTKIGQRLELIEPLQLLSTEDVVGEPELQAAQNAQLRQEITFLQLAELYQDTISGLAYRVQVHGRMEHLKNEHTANRIRSLLLAGIRSAVLWHQLGGRRWHLVFYRKRIQETAGSIRRKLIASV